MSIHPSPSTSASSTLLVHSAVVPIVSAVTSSHSAATRGSNMLPRSLLHLLHNLLHLIDDAVPSRVPVLTGNVFQQRARLVVAACSHQCLRLAHPPRRVRLIDHDRLLPVADRVVEAALALHDVRHEAPAVALHRM